MAPLTSGAIKAIIQEFSQQRAGRGRYASTGESGSFSVTGGTVLTPGNGYVYHIITSNQTLSRNSGPSTKICDILLVGGGGGGAGGNTGGGAGGGGGGAGGLVFVNNLSVDLSSPIDVIIGGGGAASPNAYFVRGTPGEDSRFAFGTPQQLVAKGGGAGAAYQYSGPDKNGGAPGGSGGGAGGGAPYTGGAAIQPTQPGNSGTYGRGSTGGSGGDAGGGGGGANAVGANGDNATGGNGGAGYPVSVFPAPLFSVPMPAPWVTAVGPQGYFAGGGAGGGYTGARATGGVGGGGNGGKYNTSPGGDPGVVNTGGGGGGSVPSAGAGGSGICIIRYSAS